MKFNEYELKAIAAEPEKNFKKQGILLIEEKSKKKLKKSGLKLVERIFRLRGNLLFYLKLKEEKKTEEPVGVIVLERCALELDDKDEGEIFPFLITFENDDPIRLAARVELERDEWMQAMHTASYECMRMQLDSVREVLRARTGHDPIDNPEPTNPASPLLGPDNVAPFLELCIVCEKLPLRVDTRPPSATVEVFCLFPPRLLWEPISQTEVVENNSNPVFLKTVCIGDCGQHARTKIKLSVYDVQELVTSTRVPVGTAVFCLSDLFGTRNNRFKFKLNSHDYTDAGYVTVMSWVSETAGTLEGDRLSGLDTTTTGAASTSGWAAIASSSSMGTSPSTASPSPRSPGSSTSRASVRTAKREQLRPLFDNILSKVFRFPTNANQELSVVEYMGESVLSYKMAAVTVAFLLECENSWTERLKRVGRLNPDWRVHQEALSDVSADFRQQWTETYKFLTKEPYASCTFRPSKNKGLKEEEVVPINLHINRMLVRNELTNEVGNQDVITVGAFTAYARKYKQGGLYRQLLHWASSSSEKRLRKSHIIASGTPAHNPPPPTNRNPPPTQNTLTAAVSSASISSIASTDSDGVVGHLNMSGVSGIDTMLSSGSLSLSTFDVASPGRTSGGGSGGHPNSKFHVSSPDGGVSIGSSESRLRLAGCLSEGCDRLHSELRGVFKDVERAAMKRDKEDIEEALAAFQTKVTEFCEICGDPLVARSMRGYHTALEGPDKLRFTMTLLTEAKEEAAATSSHLTAKIKTCLEIQDALTWLEVVLEPISRCQTALQTLHMQTTRCLAYLLIVEGAYDPFLRDSEIKSRREVVFVQALTSATTGLLAKVRTNITDESFLDQITKVGILLEFESLLSCHSEEAGMLEDFMIGVEDLSDVKYKFIENTSGSDNYFTLPPAIEGSRYDPVVLLPLPTLVFHLLPADLQRGRSFAVVPCLFNIGINEQATYAERLGNISLQENMNVAGWKILQTYYNNYKEFIPEAECVKGGGGGGGTSSLPFLLNKLDQAVHIRKNKNVDILHLAAEITERLRGVRFTSCKSAKDRTSMSVTLEEVQLLQRNHDLAAHIFRRALDCLRSAGVRRQNTFKNAGMMKYAFNSLQLRTFPKLYRPPHGTYGSGNT